MDLFQIAYDWQEAEWVKAADLYCYFPVLAGSEGSSATIDGHQVVMLGSNNYLGLTHHPEVIKAAKEAIDHYGTGCTGSRLLNGNLELHMELERELAEFLGKEGALVFNSGFLANAGTVAFWGSQQDDAIIFSEKGNHASLIDGTRLAKGEVKVFDGLDDLEKQLAERENWENALVVTDAVFSMTGEVMDLRRIADLKKKHHFRLYVDDAHGFGVLGDHGRGTAHAQGVDKDVDLLFGTFSKSLASLGGFVAGETKVLEYMKHKVRTLLFSAGLPPSSAASALAALRVMKREKAMFERLWANVKFFKEGVEKLGYYTFGTKTPIVPLFVGSESLAFRMTKEALKMGVFVTPAAHPAVPYQQALLRTSVTPAHTREQLEKAIYVFKVLMDKYRIKVDPKNLPVATEMDFSYLFPQEGTGTDN